MKKMPQNFILTQRLRDSEENYALKMKLSVTLSPCVEKCSNDFSPHSQAPAWECRVLAC